MFSFYCHSCCYELRTIQQCMANLKIRDKNIAVKLYNSVTCDFIRASNLY